MGRDNCYLTNWNVLKAKAAPMFVIQGESAGALHQRDIAGGGPHSFLFKRK